MKLQTYTDSGQYLQRAQPFMEAQETLNNLILGVTIRLRERPGWIDTAPYLATISDDSDRIQLAAAITPPYNLLAAADSNVPQAVLDLLVSNLRADGWPVPGVNAENRLAERIAQRWAAVTGQAVKINMRERVYQLLKVTPPPNAPPGCLRPAAMDDLDTVSAWRDAFMHEALDEAPPTNSREACERSIQSGTLYLWDDNGPVSMAARTRPTPNGESVGLVYTPPALRGQGYASACVAALSQSILDSGKSFCSLFTDLDYPTSNSIYQKIGYQPVCDFLSYIFI